MNGPPFDIEAFYAAVEAAAKERSPLRQDLVRGLKEYHEATVGYDRYGAETVLMVPMHMGIPHVFGYGAHRIVRDRRLSLATRANVALYALATATYGADLGIPFALLGVLSFLARAGRLTVSDLRYGLVVSFGEADPFLGLDRAEAGELLGYVAAHPDLREAERLFWSHSLLVRYGERSGALDLVDLVLSSPGVPTDGIVELCRAWLSRRQPHLQVLLPNIPDSPRGMFIRQRTQFWVAHMPSWPTSAMVRRAPVWLARLGEEPLRIAVSYLPGGDGFGDQVVLGVVDMLREQGDRLSPGEQRQIIERSMEAAGAAATRRALYQLGNELLGREYMERASVDPAGSVRQWALRHMER